MLGAGDGFFVVDDGRHFEDGRLREEGRFDRPVPAGQKVESHVIRVSVPSVVKTCIKGQR